MTERATIIFSQAGVQPPVYVVTSLSEPPWETLEMEVDKDRSSSANLVFTRHFDKVAAGNYQYKVRVGEGQWVVDESQDSAADEHGNRNNVLHVESKPKAEAPKSASNTTETPQSQQERLLVPKDSRKDSTIDAGDVAELPHIPIPIVVVDRVEDQEQLRHGDDSASEGHIEPGNEEEQAAPLFRHESFQQDDQPSTPALDSIGEASGNDQTSSEDITYTPSEPDGSLNSTELRNSPLLSHETDPEDEGIDELNNAPLLSHEAGLNTSDYGSSDDGVDELDAAPLLPHEPGFSQYKRSDVATKSDFMDDGASEPRHYMYEDDDEDHRPRGLGLEEAPTFSHENFRNDDSDHDDYDEDETPLLPHERASTIAECSSPDRYSAISPRDTMNGFFGGSNRASMFRTGISSSALPHKLPRTDADDENLADPFLEQFPIHREKILERVATIGLQLPEDETVEDHLHSPVSSVFSQTCSSVDLFPVKSYTSLASVPEADISDEEEDEEVASVSSPVVMTYRSPRKRFSRSPHATSVPNDSKRVGHAEGHKTQEPATRTTQSSEAVGVAKTEGATETVLDNPPNTTVTPSDTVKPITPPMTPERKPASTSRQTTATIPEPQLRQRQVQKESSTDETPSAAPAEQDTASTVTSSKPQNPTTDSSFFQAMFASVSRFLTSCIGDRKRAGATMFAVGVAAVAYWILALA